MLELTLSMGLLCLVVISFGIYKAMQERDGIVILFFLAFAVVSYADIRLITELVHKWA